MNIVNQQQLEKAVQEYNEAIESHKKVDIVLDMVTGDASCLETEACMSAERENSNVINISRCLRAAYGYNTKLTCDMARDSIQAIESLI